MGIFDRLRGRREVEEDGQPTVDAAAAAAVSPTLDLTEVPPPSSSSDAATPFSISAEETTRLYNPYEGLGAALDRRDVKAPFKLPSSPEFVFSEEATVHQRSWSENLTYYTGTCYLAGAILGGGAGAVRAISAPVELAGAAPSQRLRLNQLLNASGKLGRSSGNGLGVLGLMFASFESFLRYANEGRLPDEAPTLGAGAATGAVFRSVRGSRQAAAAAAVGTVAASALLAARRIINPGL